MKKKSLIFMLLIVCLIVVSCKAEKQGNESSNDPADVSVTINDVMSKTDDFSKVVSEDESKAEESKAEESKVEESKAEESNEHVCSFKGKYKYNDTEHYRECVCGKKKVSEHTLDQVVQKEAKCTEDGQSFVTCAYCDYSRKETIPNLGGHIVKTREAIAPTCVSLGNNQYDYCYFHRIHIYLNNTQT
jgi:hypothetical protein